MKPKLKRPVEGWAESSWYEVIVQFREANPKHRALFFSGFLCGPPKELHPGNYNALYSPGYDQIYTYGDLYSMKVVRKLKIDLQKPI